MDSVGFQAWALFVIGPWLYSLVDAFSRPEIHWVRANHNKALWVLAIVFLPFLAAPGYLIVVRPRLRLACRTIRSTG